MKKITVRDVIAKKREKQKISALSTYDFAFGKLVDESGIDIILVGDSVGMVSLGYTSTVPVTMRDMLHHTKAVARAVKSALIVGDMPFGSYQGSKERAVRNAKRLIQEGGADSVKVEGGSKIIEPVKAIINSGIAVMGHLGMTPQSVTQLGGYRVQGKNTKDAQQIIKDALLLEEAGVFSLVLECVPVKLAKQIAKKLSIPVIGIGAGPYVDGQILVLHDLLGFESGVHPRFVRRYSNFDQIAKTAIREFKEDVEEGNFPSLEESFN